MSSAHSIKLIRARRDKKMKTLSQNCQCVELCIYVSTRVEF